MMMHHHVAACAAFFLATLVSAPVGAQNTDQPPIADRLKAAAQENRLTLDYDGQKFSGPAWEALLAEGRNAHFFLLGEEHGIAENPKLAAALFAALIPAGYTKIAIEVSPPMARELDRAAADGGVEGLARLFAQPGGVPAFFGMKEEAEWLAAARAAAPPNEPLFWGADYEVGGDRLLVRLLEGKRKPAAAKTALADLKAAQEASWAKFAETKSPQYIFTFSGDPALVRAVKDAWPKRDADAAWSLDTLEETLEINKLWVSRQGYASNERRSAFMRANFIRHWQAEKKSGRAPKAFAKFGASHLVRGRNSSEVFDLGALLPEIAALEGGRTFHLLVLPGAGAMTAVFNPMEWTYSPAPAKDGYAAGLAPIIGEAFPDAFTLIDLRPMRPILGRARADTDPELMRIVHGFDAVLVMSGSTASANFLSDEP
ncbi:MAG: hypothetical protein WD076_08660 [Parvularculaceae bacterium]